MSRRIIVSGGASGIGAATVARFRGEGAKVAILDLDESADVVVDVADAAALRAAVERAVADLGGLDVAVAAAGVGWTGTIEQMEPDEWQRLFAINVHGVYGLARACLPALRESRGAFVAIASQLGVVAVADAAGYCATKGAVINLTRAMAIDHAREGVRFNCVCPGPTQTPLVDRYFAALPDPVATRRAYEEATVIGRMATPEEIAEAIAYLASPTAGSTIGAALVVDGGFTIQ